jgi:hypothetical protein
VDRTERHFGRAAVNMLTVGVTCGDVAVPIAWTALPDAGGSGSEDQIQVVEAVLEVVDPALVDALVADREFISARWLRRLQAEEAPFAIRLRSDRRVALPDALPEDASALPARMFVQHACSSSTHVRPARMFVQHACSSSTHVRSARMFARPIPTGEERVLRQVRLNADPSESDSTENDSTEAGPSAPLQPVDVVMKRTCPPGTSDPFLILALGKV